jgi:ribonuclease HII
MTGPDFSFEQVLIDRGRLRIAGIDEVGRGPWAGPVVAAAVVLDPRYIPPGLNDSKRLSARARDRLSVLIAESAEVSLGSASVEEIDVMNILQASHLAMVRAVRGLSRPPDAALIDGNMVPRGMPCFAQPVVGGDGRSASIAAASIMAKIRRDLGMVALAQQHPGYGWETNMGYGTKRHAAGLQTLGVTAHHRRSFKPIHKILYQEKNPTR